MTLLFPGFMSYVCVIRQHCKMTYAKTEIFNKKQQRLAGLTKALSHPARIAILEYLSGLNQCVSGDITDEIPLSRTTVSQHLQELKNAGLIKGSVSGTRVYYCIDTDSLEKLKKEMHEFMEDLVSNKNSCGITPHKHSHSHSR